MGSRRVSLDDEDDEALDGHEVCDVVGEEGSVSAKEMRSPVVGVGDARTVPLVVVVAVPVMVVAVACRVAGAWRDVAREWGVSGRRARVWVGGVAAWREASMPVVALVAAAAATMTTGEEVLLFG